MPLPIPALRRRRTARAGDRISRRGLLGALVLSMLPGCFASSPSVDRSAQTPPLTAQASRGRRVFLNDCASCHGDAGEGNGPLAGAFDPPPTDLVSSGIRISVKNLSVAIQMPHYSTRVLVDRVTTGNGEMPAWDEALTEQEIDDVVAYVRWLIQSHRDLGDAASLAR